MNLMMRRRKAEFGTSRREARARTLRQLARLRQGFVGCFLCGCSPAGAEPEPAPPPALPAPVANNAVAAVRTADGWALFSFLGIDSTRAWDGVTTASYRWDLGAPPP